MEENFLTRYLKIINEFEKINDITYIKEIRHIKNVLNNNAVIFPFDFCYPYPFCSQLISNENIFGNSRKNGLLQGNINNCLKDKDGDSYFIFNGQKIYVKVDIATNVYAYFTCCIEMHNQSPHNYGNYLHYLKYKINPHKQNIIVDCGSMEGCFEVLVKNNYDISNILFVCIDPDITWNKSINKTLTELGANYIIINEFINNENTLENILLKNNLNPNDVICIKSDIEGDDVNLIKNYEKYLINKPLCLICTYHNQDDALLLYDIFDKYYTDIEFSKGYLLPLSDELKYPYFRKALIISH